MAPISFFFIISYISFAGASSLLADYVTAWTGRNLDEVGSLCEIPRMDLKEGRASGQTVEGFLLHGFLLNPELGPLTNCLVSKDLVLPSLLMSSSGGALLFASASPRLFSSTWNTVEPGALFWGVLSRGAPRNYTLGKGDGFNVLHKVFSSDKRTTDDVANILLQDTLPQGLESYVNLTLNGCGISAGGGGGALDERFVRDESSGRVLGRSIPSTLVRSLANCVSLNLLKALSKFPAPVGQPSLATLASQRDKFGRTPLHMAALQGNAEALATLTDALKAEFSAEEARRLIHCKDATGYTPLQLALLSGHTAAVKSLESVWGGPSSSSVGPVHSVTPHPSQQRGVGDDDDDDDDGGWGEPELPSMDARKAIRAAAASSHSSSCCSGGGVDVVQASQFTAAIFVSEYFLPCRPVLIRGLAVHWGVHAWRRHALVEAHGHVLVHPSRIPYGNSFGENESTSPLPLRDFVESIFTVRHFVGATTTTTTTEVVPSVTENGAEHSLPSYVFQRVRHPGTHPLFKSNHTAFPAAFLAEARVPTWPNLTQIPLLALGPDATSVEIFIGAPGTGAPMHYHGDAYNALMFGRKKWYLLPPHRAAYSTVHAVDFVTQQTLGGRGASQEGTPMHECIQGSGDVLYIPRGWGHAVLNLNTSVGFVVEFSTAHRRY